MTCWARRSERLCENTRAAMSLEPPGAKGAINLIGCVGHASAASASAGQSAIKADAIADRIEIIRLLRNKWSDPLGPIWGQTRCVLGYSELSNNRARHRTESSMADFSISSFAFLEGRHVRRRSLHRSRFCGVRRPQNGDVLLRPAPR